MKVKVDIPIGKPNCNGIVHSLEVYYNAVKEYLLRSHGTGRPSVGRFLRSGYGNNFDVGVGSCIDLAEASHVVNDVYLVDGSFEADITILETRNGKILQSLTECEELYYRFVSRGTATIEGIKIVNYVITCFDFIPIK